MNAWKRRVPKKADGEIAEEHEIASSVPTSSVAGSRGESVAKLPTKEELEIEELLGSVDEAEQRRRDNQDEVIEVKREKTQDELLAEVLQWTPGNRQQDR